MSHAHTIMGRIHVFTSASEALAHAFSVVRPNVIRVVPGRSIFYYASECLKAHEDNRREYVRVMTGRVK